MLGENITQQSAIKNLMKNLDDSSIVGGWALDSAVYSASHGRFKNTADLISWFKNDCESYSVSGDDYGSKNLKADFLQEYCGINLRNDDTDPGDYLCIPGLFGEYCDLSCVSK